MGEQGFGQQEGGTILIVDPQVESIHVLAGVLAHEGYKVQGAVTSAQAWAAIAAQTPDLVLLDTQTFALDDYELCQQFKSSPLMVDIPMIVMSAGADLSEQSKAFAAGASDYIRKPFQAEDVVLRISHQIRMLRQHQQLKQAEAKYRSMFENATEGIFQATLSGQFISANPALARIFGYGSPEELMTSIQDIGQQFYVRPERRDELKVYLQLYQEISGAESEVFRKDGKKIWIAENVRVVQDAAGNFLYYEGTMQEITERRQTEMELRQERQRAERLLTNVLPFQIARRLKVSARTIADQYDEVTVLFADLVNFTSASTQMPPGDLVALLNRIFSTFDQLAERRGLEKIKTIGDAYMVAAGLPVPKADHALEMAHMALEMQSAIQQFYQPNGAPFQLRIGFASGSVIAGVIGIKKFIYDLWGDTVNVASRMESTGEPGKIQVPDATYERLKNDFEFEKRGLVDIKGKGEMITYWLVGAL